MSAVNIGGSSKDSSYRYKMPRLVAKVEGRGNGIKTRIVNMADIAKALGVPPSYPTKYFGFELGAQARWTESTASAIVNGAFTASDLQKQLEGFVQAFVLCPGCGLPEIDLSVKRSAVVGTCSACGAEAPVGTGHRLVGYITKNPPPKKKGSGQAAARAAAAADADPFANDLIQLTGEDLPDDADVEWHTDVSESAVLERQKDTIGASKLLAEMGAVTIERDIVDSVDAFRQWYEGGDRSLDDVAEYLAELKRTYAHADAELVGAFCDVVWDTDILATLPDHVAIIEPYTSSKSGSKVLLGSVERLCGEKYRDELLKYTGHILKALYELDLVDEAIMLKWREKKSSKYVRNAVSVEVKTAGANFLDWLAEAEDEYSEYESDDDDDDAAAASKPADEPSRFARGAASIAAAAAGDDDDDDFDIDDI